ncbi:SpoIVB peptidase [Anaeromicrobium sediminis]|uniref:SpoIVB peptidase n=1 Tax=Anaeromicrobium sediminis TaxID=1478221 RepID=A0A267MQ02_9FIRM|nr:SpoIVB peptidase [Anaeromicrobium sediminis]PAB60975.1 SpoIVB peptidase [Anaeromicrobium sediminis]
MTNYKNKRFFLLFFILIVFSLFACYDLVNVLTFPNNVRVFENEKQPIDVNFPFKVSTLQEENEFLRIQENNYTTTYVNPIKKGKTNLELNFLGLIPIKKVTVNIMPKLKVIPGGQCIGVKLNTKGVLVVGTEDIKGIDGKKYNPSHEAGIAIGDTILEINGEKVKDSQHVISVINENKEKSLKLKVKRKNRTFKTSITPVQTYEEKDYKIGLWVRDKTAGVGTLTFYEPNSKVFGALGHAITDIDTGLLLTVEKGEVIKSKVASIKQGKRGKPGEIKGIFYDTNRPIGKLEYNTKFGIYGHLYKPMDNSIYSKPIEVAGQHEIKVGKATILTTIENSTVEEYDVYIEKVSKQRSCSTKGMVIKVTDKRLLKRTGGIVQGMSGSPIIQNGKLVGAITHVFVNDPTKGYGIFIEWMIDKAQIQQYESKLARRGCP